MAWTNFSSAAAFRDASRQVVMTASRRALGREQADPEIELDVVAELLHGRHVGQRRARVARQKQASGRSLPAFICAFAAAIDDTSTCELLPRMAVSAGPPPAVGRVPHLDAGALHEQRRRQVQRAVQAGRTEDQAVRPLLGVVDELLQGLVRLLVVDDEHHRIGDEARDRDEVVARELHRPAEQLVDLGEARDRRRCASSSV